MSVSDSWPGGCELGTRLRRAFFPAYFRLSPLLKYVGSCVAHWEIVWLVIQGSWVRASLDPNFFFFFFFFFFFSSSSSFVGVSLGKTLQSPSLVKDMNKVIWLKYCWRQRKTPFSQSEACEKRCIESCVRTSVRKPGNTCASPTAKIWP